MARNPASFFYGYHVSSLQRLERLKRKEPNSAKTVIVLTSDSCCESNLFACLTDNRISSNR